MAVKGIICRLRGVVYATRQRSVNTSSNPKAFGAEGWDNSGYSATVGTSQQPDRYGTEGDRAMSFCFSGALQGLSNGQKGVFQCS